MKKIGTILIVIILAVIIFLFVSPEFQKIVGINKTPPKIGVQPFGNIPAVEVDSVANAIEKMFGFKTIILENKPLPDMAYTEIRYPRYRADSLLKWLAFNPVDSADVLIGLTNKDISITKYKKGSKEIKDPEWKYKDFGIYGLGAINGNACVVSSNRLHNNVSSAIFYKRLCRISCHEIGHVLGLRHCPEKNCLMNDANESIHNIDISTGNLCKKCWSKI